MTASLDFPDFDAHIRRAVAWLYDTRLDNETGCGWAHYAGHPHVTEWGGTLEGIRALIRAGEYGNDIKVAKAVEWLKNAQLPDGGWKSWEIKQSCVEATAWVVITLKMYGEPPESSTLAKGVNYLARCATLESDQCCWGAFKGAQPRVYPSLLSVWALSGVHNDFTGKGATWLRNAVNADGGWGFLPRDEASNVVITSMVLFVLSTTGRIDDKSNLTRRAQNWILESLSVDGTWENEIEDWIAYIDPGTKEDFPSQTKHFAMAWALIGLLRSGASILDERIRKNLLVLAQTQQDDGSWIFSRGDPKRHTWCTANALWALVEARSAFYSPRNFSALTARAASAPLFSLRVQVAILYVVVIVMLGEHYVDWTAVRGGFEAVVSLVGGFLKRNSEAVIASIIAGVFLALSSFLWRLWIGLRAKHKDLEQRPQDMRLKVSSLLPRLWTRLRATPKGSRWRLRWNRTKKLDQ